MRYCKYLPLIALIFTSVLSAQEYGYIRITCDRDSLPIFLDGGELGVSPIRDSIKVPIGAHTISFFPISTIEEAERELKAAKDKGTLAWMFGGLGAVAGAAIGEAFAKMDLQAIEAGTKTIFVQAGRTVMVYLDYTEVEEIMEAKKKAKGRLESLYWGCIIGACVLYLLLSAAGS